MSKVPSISSHSRFAEPTFGGVRTLTSVKNSHRPDNNKRKGAVTPAPRSRFFITQEDTAGEFYDKTFDATSPNKDYGIPKGYHYLSDKKVKGILGRLDSTVTKLNNAWDSCEKSIAKSSSLSLLRPQKHSTTFALTEATIGGFNQSVSTKASGVHNLLSMTMSDFLSPDMSLKMHQIAQNVDMDVRTNEIRDHLWDHINKGRDYFNLLKEEVRKKREKLQNMKERLELIDVMADNRDLEVKIVQLSEEIMKAEENIEMAEMDTDVLHNTILMKKRDKVLYEKKFTLKFFPYTKIEKDLDRGIDNILSMERVFQQYMNDMSDLKKDTKENVMMVNKIRTAQKIREQKDLRFEENIEMERIYRKKRKTFIIKTKKEIEDDQQRRREREEDLQRENLRGLQELKLEYENNFDLLSTVSKKYENKEEYVEHLNKLRENNEELEKTVQEMSEDINLKRKIDLPTLQAELTDLRGSKDTATGFGEGNRLRKELNEKNKRNEMMETSLGSKQKLNTNLMRGVMTIFNNVSIVKDYLNLNKLDNIKLKLDNLGDVLLFCGEVVEILENNRQAPAEVRSQPLSIISLSDEE